MPTNTLVSRKQGYLDILNNNFLYSTYTIVSSGAHGGGWTTHFVKIIKPFSRLRVTLPCPISWFIEGTGRFPIIMTSCGRSHVDSRLRQTSFLAELFWVIFNLSWFCEKWYEPSLLWTNTLSPYFETFLFFLDYEYVRDNFTFTILTKKFDWVPDQRPTSTWFHWISLWVTSILWTEFPHLFHAALGHFSTPKSSRLFLDRQTLEFFWPASTVANINTVLISSWAFPNNVWTRH